MAVPMVVAICSVKDAPGVSTLALGLAALWPDEPGVVLAECDPSGGDLAARFGHYPDPGLLSLAAAARGGPGQVDLAGHTQRLGSGADVVLAPPGEAAAAGVATLAGGGRGVLRHVAARRTVIVDVGRIYRGGPGLALASAADHVLVVCGASLAAQAQVAARLEWLRPAVAGRLWLVRAGRGYHPEEISRDLGVPVIWSVPRSRLVAGALNGTLRVPNWPRLGMGRAIGQIATTLVTAQPAMVVPHPRIPTAHRVEVPS
jgi:hypothetical protein